MMAEENSSILQTQAETLWSNSTQRQLNVFTMFTERRRVRPADKKEAPPKLF